jgi:hypothetical protein
MGGRCNAGLVLKIDGRIAAAAQGQYAGIATLQLGNQGLSYGAGADDKGAGFGLTHGLIIVWLLVLSRL